MTRAPEVRGKLISALAVAAILASACESARQPAREDFAASATAKRYELTGTVVSVDQVSKLVTIEHEAIPDLMKGMTMPFKIKEQWAYGALASGNHVTATLVLDGDRSWLEGIVIVQGASADASEGIARSDVTIGATLPDVTLQNQDGREVRVSQYRGKLLAITFIYTRCPLPDYCPLMTQNFAAIARHLDKAPGLVDAVHLLSVTIDPEYDAPPVLRDYGSRQVGGTGPDRFRHWEFLTGRPDQIRSLATALGLDYLREGDQVVHSLRTALVDGEGRVVNVYSGNDWTVEEVMKEIRARAAAPRS